MRAAMTEAEYMRRRRSYRVSVHICPECGGNPVGDLKRCERCLEGQRVRQQRYHKRELQRKAAARRNAAISYS